MGLAPPGRRSLPARICKSLRLHLFCKWLRRAEFISLPGRRKSKLERCVRMGGGALSPESENHYPLLLKCLDENAILKQCIDFPHAHTHSSPRAAQELSAPRSLLSEPGKGGFLRAGILPGFALRRADARRALGGGARPRSRLR